MNFPASHRRRELWLRSMCSVGVDLGSLGRVAIRSNSSHEIITLPAVESYFRYTVQDGLPSFLFGSLAIPTSKFHARCSFRLIKRLISVAAPPNAYTELLNKEHFVSLDTLNELSPCKFEFWEGKPSIITDASERENVHLPVLSVYTLLLRYLIRSGEERISSVNSSVSSVTVAIPDMYSPEIRAAIRESLMRIYPEFTSTTESLAAARGFAMDNSEFSGWVMIHDYGASKLCISSFFVSPQAGVVAHPDIPPLILLEGGDELDREMIVMLILMLVDTLGPRLRLDKKQCIDLLLNDRNLFKVVRKAQETKHELHFTDEVVVDLALDLNEEDLTDIQLLVKLQAFLERSRHTLRRAEDAFEKAVQKFVTVVGRQPDRLLAVGGCIHLRRVREHVQSLLPLSSKDINTTDWIVRGAAFTSFPCDNLPMHYSVKFSTPGDPARYLQLEHIWKMWDGMRRASRVTYLITKLCQVYQPSASMAMSIHAQKIGQLTGISLNSPGAFETLLNKWQSTLRWYRSANPPFSDYSHEFESAIIGLAAEFDNSTVVPQNLGVLRSPSQLDSKTYSPVGETNARVSSASKPAQSTRSRIADTKINTGSRTNPSSAPEPHPSSLPSSLTQISQSSSLSQLEKKCVRSASSNSIFMPKESPSAASSSKSKEIHTKHERHSVTTSNLVSHTHARIPTRVKVAEKSASIAPSSAQRTPAYPQQGTKSSASSSARGSSFASRNHRLPSTSKLLQSKKYG